MDKRKKRLLKERRKRETENKKLSRAEEKRRRRAAEERFRREVEKQRREAERQRRESSKNRREDEIRRREVEVSSREEELRRREEELRRREEELGRRESILNKDLVSVDEGFWWTEGDDLDEGGTIVPDDNTGSVKIPQAIRESFSGFSSIWEMIDAYNDDLGVLEGTLDPDKNVDVNEIFSSYEDYKENHFKERYKFNDLDDYLMDVDLDKVKDFESDVLGALDFLKGTKYIGAVEDFLYNHRENLVVDGKVVYVEYNREMYLWAFDKTQSSMHSSEDFVSGLSYKTKNALLDFADLIRSSGYVDKNGKWHGASEDPNYDLLVRAFAISWLGDKGYDPYEGDDFDYSKFDGAEFYGYEEFF